MQVRLAHAGLVVEVGEDRQDATRLIVKVTEAGAEGQEPTVHRVSVPARATTLLLAALQDVLEIAAEADDGAAE